MPDRWVEVAIGDIAHVLRGASPRPKGDPRYYGGDVPRLMVADVTRDGRYVTPCIDFLTKEGAALSRPMPKGTLTIVCSGDVGRPSFLAVDACIHDGFLALDEIDECCDKNFLFEVLSQLKTRLERSATHGGVFTNLTTDILREFTFQLPPLSEQRKIAEILRTWGEGIEKLEGLLAAKRKRLKGLSQKFLGRGGVFPKGWELRPLSEVTTRVRRQNGGRDHPVMTISAKSGFLLQSDKFARDMAGSSVERYTLLHEGEFAYNKGNSQTAPYGCIFALDRPTALVPFVYFCFALNKTLSHEFYTHLFAAGALNYQLSRLINSGVRNDGLLNLNPEDFFACRIPVPPDKEQRAIAAALTAAKTEIALIEEQRDALNRQKRGLMQKLLTGEWRVKVAAKEVAA